MAGERDESARQGIQSVENAMQVLLALEAGGGELTLGEVAARVGEAPSKVHRYLVSLCRVGLASQSSRSGRYDLGPSMRRLGAEALRRTNEVGIAADYTEALRDATGYSVNTAVWSDDGPIIVRWDYGTHALPLSVRVGATLPLLASSAGRVFLAHLPERMTADALAASQHSVRSPKSSAEVAAIIDDVRRTGVAVQTGGVIPGASSISAIVLTASDTLPFTVSVVLPGERLDDAERQRTSAALLSTVRQISQQIGAPGVEVATA